MIAARDDPAIGSERLAAKRHQDFLPVMELQEGPTTTYGTLLSCEVSQGQEDILKSKNWHRKGHQRHY